MQHRPYMLRFPGLLRWRKTCCIAAALVLSCVALDAAAGQDASTPSGEQVFKQGNCAICHGQLGGGGAGPALRGDRMLRVADYVVAQIMVGRGIMPSFAAKLSDAEIAAVASYIRSSWGNDFGKVTAEDAGKVRQVLRQENALPGKAVNSKQQP